MEPDDLIVNVDGETTKGWTTEDAVKKITGASDKPLELIRRFRNEKLPAVVSPRLVGITSSPRSFTRRPVMPWNSMAIAFGSLFGAHTMSYSSAPSAAG